ncbi:MAG: fibronectin type III domain-containing protein [Ruminococcus sp.]|nr:fibronectin type III domain-containing protein [Ruminococcus sp.]
MKKQLIKFIMIISAVLALCFSVNAIESSDATTEIKLKSPSTITLSDYSHFYYYFLPEKSGSYEITITASKPNYTNVFISDESDYGYSSFAGDNECSIIANLEEGTKYLIELYNYAGDGSIDYTTSVTVHDHNYVQTIYHEADFEDEGYYENSCSKCDCSDYVTVPAVTNVKLSSTSYTYDGKAKNPSVVVKDSNGNTLKKGIDYTVSGELSTDKIGSHTIKVTLKGHYSGSKNLTYKIIPAKVNGVKVSSQTSSSINLTWASVIGADGYVIYSYNSANKEYSRVSSASKNSATVSKLKAGTTYKYSIRAYKKVNDKNVYSSYSSITTTTTKPVAPTLKATQKSNEITLSWNKVTGSSGYIVYSYDSNSKKCTKIATVTTNKTTIKKLKPATTYKYAVKAYKKFNDKNYYSIYSKILTTTTKPARPSGLKATSATTSIKLTWSKVTNATGYRIQRYDSENSKWVTLANVKTNSYTHSKTKINVTNKYRVAAYKTLNEQNYLSDYSSTISARALPNNVTGLKAISTASSIKLTWSKISGATGYRIYKYDSNNKKYIKVADTKNNTYTISNLKPSTSYKYAVKAYTKSGDKYYFSTSYTAISIKTKAPSTNTSTTKPSTSKPSKPKQTTQITSNNSSTTYILNTNSGKFHKPSCHMVNKMSASNKRSVTYSYSTMISYGYSPCKKCLG